MPNVNLSSGSLEDRRGSRNVGVNWGLIILAIIFLASIAAWFVLSRINGDLDAKITERQNEYSALQAEMSGGKAGDILDFKNRLELAGELEKKNLNLTENLAQLEKAMVNSGVYINSYSYSSEDKTIDLSLMGDNYINLAREVLALKQLGYFSEVTAGVSSFSDQDKKYSLAVVLKLK